MISNRAGMIRNRAGMISKRAGLAGVLSLFVLAVFVLAACASRGHAPARVMPRPTNPTEAREQIALLERDISRDRRRIGLPRRSVDSTGQPTGAKLSTQSADTRRRPMPAAPAAQRLEATPAAGSPSSSRDARAADRCRHTHAICRAARHICRLADYVADDDSRDRCKRASSDCREARRVTQC